MRVRLRHAIAACALGCIAGAAAAHTPQPRSAAELMDALMWNREPIGGPFALVDQHGQRRTDADFRGKLMLVYFGFTACADICPTDLQQIGLALQKLGPAGDAVQPIFITLDPRHDTPDRLRAYVENFHPRMVGLGGTDKAVQQAAQAYRVYNRKVAAPKGAGYTIDHSAVIYLMDREGRYLGFMPPGTSAERLMQVLQPFLQVR